MGILINNHIEIHGRDELLELAERAAGPDASATDHAEICKRVAEISEEVEGEPLIEVLKLLHMEHHQKKVLESQCNAWRKAFRKQVFDRQ